MYERSKRSTIATHSHKNTGKNGKVKHRKDINFEVSMPIFVGPFPKKKRLKVDKTMPPVA